MPHGEIDRELSHLFLGIEIRTLPDVLAPRPETEILCRRAIEVLSARGPDQPLRVIDLCCGSGNLAVAIATHVPDCHVWASDLTLAAYETTLRNVERHGLRERITVRRGDMFAPLDADVLEGSINLMVCNPPYISTGRLEGASAHLLRDEPREAFDGGPFGISIHQRLFREAGAFLKPGGTLLCEFGEGQSRQISALAKRAGYPDILFVADSSGEPRVAELRKSADGSGEALRS